MGACDMMLLGAGCAGVVSGGGPSYLLYDTFAGASGNLSGRTPDTAGSGTWSETNLAGGNWTINGSGKCLDPNGNGSQAMYDATSGDVSLSCTVQTDNATPYFGAHVRTANTPLADGILGIATGSTINVYVNGVSKASASVTLSLNTDYTLTILARSDYIVTAINGVYATWITSTNQSNTKCGLYSDAGGTHRTFDQIAVIAAPAQTTYVSDGFVASNGTALSTYNAAWSVLLGTYDIQSNRANCTSVSTYGIAVRDGTVSDGEITFIVNLSSTSRVGGLVVRCTNSNNLWFVRLGGSAASVPGISLYENVAGVYTQRALDSVSLGAGDHTIKCVMAGASISATVDGANTIAYHAASSNSTATLVGMLAVATTSAFDDLMVKSL